MTHIDQDILTIQQVSCLLGCCVDTIYRIPRDQLPVYRVGKVNLYLREDVKAYLRNHCRRGCAAADKLAADKVLELFAEPGLQNPGDGVRGRS